MKKTITAIFLLVLSLSVSAQKIDPKKVYQISTSGGLVLDNQGSISSETRMYLGVPDNESQAQAWQFRDLGNGAYQLVNAFSFQALDCDGTGGSTLSYSGRMRNLTRINIGLSLSLKTVPAR